MCYNIVPALCFHFFGCKPCGILAPPTRDQNCTPCIAGLKHLTTRGVLSFGDFCGVNTLTDLKLTSWHHWVQSWEEIRRGRPLYTQCIRAAVTEYLSDIYFSWSWRPEVQDQSVDRFSVWWGPDWLPWCLNGKESACQCRRHRRGRFDARVGKISWKRKWQPTPVCLPR